MLHLKRSTIIAIADSFHSSDYRNEMASDFAKGVVLMFRNDGVHILATNGKMATKITTLETNEFFNKNGKETYVIPSRMKYCFEQFAALLKETSPNGAEIRHIPTGENTSLLKIDCKDITLTLKPIDIEKQEKFVNEKLEPLKDSYSATLSTELLRSLSNTFQYYGNIKGLSFKFNKKDPLDVVQVVLEANSISGMKYAGVIMPMKIN